MAKCEKEKASSLLFKRLEEKVEYGVPKMADFEQFKDETINGMQNGNDQSKYISKRFDQFNDSQSMFNKFVKDNIAKYDTAIENHDDRIKRCLNLLAEKDQQVQTIFDKFSELETDLVAQE